MCACVFYFFIFRDGSRHPVYKATSSQKLRRGAAALTQGKEFLCFYSWFWSISFVPLQTHLLLGNLGGEQGVSIVCHHWGVRNGRQRVCGREAQSLLPPEGHCDQATGSVLLCSTSSWTGLVLPAPPLSALKLREFSRRVSLSQDRLFLMIGKAAELCPGTEL